MLQKILRWYPWVEQRIDWLIQRLWLQPVKVSHRRLFQFQNLSNIVLLIFKVKECETILGYKIFTINFQPQLQAKKGTRIMQIWSILFNVQIDKCLFVFLRPSKFKVYFLIIKILTFDTILWFFRVAADMTWCNIDIIQHAFHVFDIFSFFALHHINDRCRITSTKMRRSANWCSEMIWNISRKDARLPEQLQVEQTISRKFMTTFWIKVVLTNLWKS